MLAGRPTERASFRGDPGAKFLWGTDRISTKKEKRSKKERKQGLWKLTRCGNAGKIVERKRFSHRFHSAWKTLRPKRCEFPTVPTGPMTAAIHLKKGDFLSEEWGARPKTHVRPKWGNEFVHCVKTMAVQNWLDEYPHSRQVKSHIRRYMHILFNAAIRWEMLERNPIDLVRQPSKWLKAPSALTPDNLGRF